MKQKSGLLYKKNSSAGFSLVEMMASLTIMGVLLLAAIAMLKGVSSTSNLFKSKNSFDEIENRIKTKLFTYEALKASSDNPVNASSMLHSCFTKDGVANCTPTPAANSKEARNLTILGGANSSQNANGQEVGAVGYAPVLFLKGTSQKYSSLATEKILFNENGALCSPQAVPSAQCPIELVVLMQPICANNGTSCDDATALRFVYTLSRVFSPTNLKSATPQQPLTGFQIVSLVQGNRAQASSLEFKCGTNKVQVGNDSSGSPLCVVSSCAKDELLQSLNGASGAPVCVAKNKTVTASNTSLAANTATQAAAALTIRAGVCPPGQFAWGIDAYGQLACRPSSMRWDLIRLVANRNGTKTYWTSTGGNGAVASVRTDIIYASGKTHSITNNVFTAPIYKSCVFQNFVANSSIDAMQGPNVVDLGGGAYHFWWNTYDYSGKNDGYADFQCVKEGW